VVEIWIGKTATPVEYGHCVLLRLNQAEGGPLRNPAPRRFQVRPHASSMGDSQATMSKRLPDR